MIFPTICRSLLLLQLNVAGVVGIDTSYSISVENATTLEEFSLELSQELTREFSKNLLNEVFPTDCCTHRSNGYQECHADHRCNSSKSKCLNTKRCGVGNVWMDVVPAPKTGCCSFDGSMTQCPHGIHADNPQCHYFQSDCEDLSGGNIVCGGTWITEFEPSNSPTKAPSWNPTFAPTMSHQPSSSPTATPTASAPTKSPINAPIAAPTNVPIHTPTKAPTSAPTNSPTNGPTAAPTNAPTSAPTNALTKVPTNVPTVSAPMPLVIAGDNGTPTESFPLGLCEGDCDYDGECQYGLFCFERDGTESVPGCEGTGQSGKDYCSKCPNNYLCTYGDEGLPVGSFPLGECQGDCDDDGECAPGLVCFQRNGIEKVPGCSGSGESGRDYCYDPNNTVSPSASPSGTPPPIAAPTKVPTHAPTNSPTPPPVDIIDPRSGIDTVTCPPAGGGEHDLPDGLKLFGLSEMNEFCGVFIKTASGNLIPFARSYDSNAWEPAAGPHACLQEDITCNTDENGDTLCGLDLPSLVNSTLAGSTYVIITKDGSMDQSSQIAAFLEMTTFGPTKSEINALNAAPWDDVARAGYVRSQMDMPATSHREYYRRRVNTKWDATQQSARSDHPCSPNSKWRKYAFIKQDRHDTITSEEDIHTTFEVVPEEADLVTTIYEAEDSSGSVTFDRGSFLSSSPGFSGTGYYDMSGDGDYIQWSISSYLAGSYPVSFRYAHGSTGNNGQRPLDLYVNDVFVKTMDFTFTDWWQYYKYTELVDVDLVEGTNTIKLLVNNGYGGPNIDHMRIGKPPAVVIKTNGWPRTVAKNGVGLLDDWGVDLNGMAVTMPSYPDPPQGDLFRYVFGRTKVKLDSGSQKYLDIGNPPIDFTGYEQYLNDGYFTFSNSDNFTSTASHLFSYPLLEGQEYILTTGLTDDLCNSIPPFSEEYDAPVFGKLPNGEWLVWSPSILLEDNGPSINTPKSDLASATLEDGGGAAVIQTNEKLKCANVPRTFVNEDTCVLSTLSTACKASELSSVDVAMSTENVKKFYNLTGRYVYAIRGLAMEELREHPCSKPKSRWEISAGVTCPSATVLNAHTITALTDAITKSFDSNPFVKDVTRTLLCDSSDYDDLSDELDIQLQIGPDCYTHVHPDHLNVYDFSGWVSVHNGGAYNIQKWAEGFDGHEGWYLMYPYAGVPKRNVPQHPMSRWVNNGNGDNIVYVSRLGDSVPYRDLIDPLKTDAVANYFGASASGSVDGIVVCGSYGEVANDPSLPEVFDLRSDEQSTTDSSVLNNQKHVIWTEVNLKSNDQLRQRVAWALSQILTIVPGNIDGDQRTEMYTYFYDILVRHAFGNYRDILGEISFSPLMAEHLSYLKSKSHSYVFSNSNMISRADENYAREIMQLFSIGLLKLRADGTIKVDESGAPLQAYTNEDIESFARAWTGFDRTAARGNIEQISRGSTDNRLDPMQIVPDWRDPFPKSNLDGGFIGDRYELCVDVTTKSFLKKGAHYRLLGGSSSPEMTKDPSYFADPANSVLRAELDPTSALYLQLFNGGNFELDVIIENDLTCVGIECNVDTLRVVKVGNVFYEFVEKPCVQLAFYDNAKRIQLRDNTKQGQMCANPDLPHAREACCRQDRFREVRYATTSYLYDGERMTFSTAKERCGSLCMFEDVNNINWWKKGYHWTPKECSIWVKINSEGYVAIVHDTDIAYINTIPYHLQEESTLNWFRVFWDGNGDYPGSSATNSCSANYCKTMSDGSCLCKTSVTDSPVFSDSSNLTVEDVLAELFIGASGPPSGSVGTDLGSGIVVHKMDDSVDESTVFEVSDDKGRTFFLKNVRSTVNVNGWEGKIPEIYEAEDATKYNVTVQSSSSATGGKYIDYDLESYLEWNVAVNTPGTYKLSFRYALDSHPRPLSIFVNSVEVTKEAVNPSIPVVYFGGTPSADKFPLKRCEGDCDEDNDCADGLFCKQNDALEENPGCEGGSGSGRDYCVDPLDYTHGVLFYPTGGWNSDWLYTDPLEVYLAAGQNTISARVPVGYKDGPNVDHMKLEGLTKVSAQKSSFRNPPHFMSLISDSSPYGIGEMNLRDALYETEAVLDHYFYQDNVAPFLCTRMIQRFGISNPSPRYVETCSTAFKSGAYNSGSSSFGSGDYGSLEAMVAAIILDKEATSSSVSMDPGYGSVKEPIMKVLALMRSMEYQPYIPDTLPGPPMHNDYQVKLWYIHEKIGQGPYEFPTVFSFFLPEYIPDNGPALVASLVSPETMILTMPNTVSLLNGLFSLIKYGLGDCNNGFSIYPGYSGCSDDGKYERSLGRLSYQPSGATFSDKIADLALLLTADRLSGQNQATILQACSTEPNEASMLRCAQQLIITTAEFHTTNRVERSGEVRSAETSVGGTSNEPYKAIVYFYLGGGLDSYNMLVPYNCAPIDVYEKYRTIRGKNDVSEGIGLPKTRLLQISTNVGDPNDHLGQPCSSFGIHENLPTIKNLYDQRQVNFIANAGLLAKPVDVSNYNDETPVQLFAHNAMTMEAAREDLADKYSGTGIGGRMADVFSKSGIPTNTFSIDGQQILLTGEAGQGPSQFILSSSGLSEFNADPSITGMNEVIRSLNNATTPDSGFFAETWSSKLSEAMIKQEQLKTEVDSTSVTATFPDSGIGRQLEMVSRIMQTRQARGVKRDIFYVTDGGYDTHADVDINLVENFATIDGALNAFVSEMKTLNLWESTTVVQFSEFARTLDPNTGDGSDHGWGGIHFMLGGSVNGGKVLGSYPDDFIQSPTNPIALSRGRMIPTHPWDAMWLGTAEWFGIKTDEDLDKVLPMHKNFDSSLLYAESELFVVSETATA